MASSSSQFVVIKQEPAFHQSDNAATVVKQEPGGDPNFRCKKLLGADIPDYDPNTLYTSSRIHCRTVEPKRRPRTPSEIWYKCKICSRVYETTAGCTSHIVIKHCIMNHEERQPYIIEELIYSSFPCPDCNTHLDSQVELVAHLKERHNKIHDSPFKCLKCHKASGTEAEVRQHLRKEHRVVMETEIKKLIASDDEYVLRCQVCGALFPCKSNLIRHINRYHSTDAKDHSGRRSTSTATATDQQSATDVKPVINGYGKVSSQVDVKPQLPAPPTLLMCPFKCKETFDNKLDLQKHVRLGVHTRPENTVEVSSCRHCGSKFSLNDPCKCRIVKDFNLCRICRKPFLCQKRLNLHYLTDHEDEYTKDDIVGIEGVKKDRVNSRPSERVRYKCRFCTVSALTKADLFIHWKAAHRKTMVQYKCPYCAISYSTREGLMKHLKEKHGKIEIKKISKCPFCPKQFVDAQLRMQHVLFGSHHFRCDECDLDFVNLSCKNEHELTKHSSGKTAVKGLPAKLIQAEKSEKETPDVNLNESIVKVEPDIDVVA